MSGCSATILIVEDDDQVRRVLRLACESAQHRVLVAATGADAVRVIESTPLDVILLDVSLPDISGLDVCRRIRAAGVTTPVIMVSGLGDLIDVVVGLEVGADDYLRKPFQVRELLARIGAQLRRRQLVPAGRGEVLEIGSLMVDVDARRVLRDGAEVALTVTQFDLLVLLASRRGEVVSRDEMLRVMWEAEQSIDVRTIDAHIHRLRRRIDTCDTASCIETVPGIGYRLAAMPQLERPRLHVVA